MHRWSRILSTALVTAGLVVLADAAATVIWQEPFSAAYGSLQQGRADDRLDEIAAEFGESVAADIADLPLEEQARVLAKLFDEQVEKGDPIGRIEIDAIGVDKVLMNGTDTSTLKSGPGRYLSTPLPGRGSTTGVAGHRTTYGAPFNRIDDLSNGDEIRVEMPYGAFTYEVEGHEIVSPERFEVTRPVGYERIVLTACHPEYSAAERYVVYARLADIGSFAISGEGRWPAP
ncbi:MAG: class E sortase [Solirubrobacterales bacterium]